MNTLEINGQLTSNPSSIQHHILAFYKDLLGTPGLKFGFLDDQFWDLEDKLTALEQWSLERSFTEEELKHALFASEPNGAPGPDGFIFKFYQFFWDVVRSDLMVLTHYFFENTLDLHKINKSCICLIPKEKDAKLITKFRLISLVNFSFKLLSKLLTIRLEPIMFRIIDPSQSAFIKHRFILDNVILSQEILHSC